MKNVVIIGSNGLIGIYLTRSLHEAGMNVYPSARKDKYPSFYRDLGLSLIEVDIRNRADFDNLPQSGVDAVVFAAGLLPANMEGYHPEKYFETNTLGALNVLEYCRKCGAKQVIYFQSHSDVYGHWGTGIIDPYAPKSLNYNDDHTVYVISKLAAEELIKNYHKAYGLRYCILRCPNIYAWLPAEYYYVNGEKKAIAYRKLIKQACAGEKIEIWGDCKVPRDMVYVKDLVQLVQKSILCNVEHSIYNVSTGEGTTLEEEIKTIVDVFSPSAAPSVITYRPDIPIREASHRYSITNAVAEIGYKPAYNCKGMFEDMKKEKDSGFWDFMA